MRSSLGAVFGDRVRVGRRAEWGASAGLARDAAADLATGLDGGLATGLDGGLDGGLDWVAAGPVDLARRAASVADPPDDRSVGAGGGLAG
ncbi:MAG TPA: hypothetical protein VED63_00680 [Acidimicrobiales bacterium]|nr:hypothetical protein [Acidimicrobiales bacterium]